MEFDPEEIEKLSPEARVEVQHVYAIRYLAESRPAKPERRKRMRQKFFGQRWPHRWYRNESQLDYKRTGEIRRT